MIRAVTASTSTLERVAPPAWKNRQRTAPVMGAMWKALGFDASALEKSSSLLEGSMDVSMRILLATLRERHGDPLVPLREAGLSGDTIARLRARAVAA